MAQVIVVGGGLAGLTAAYELSKLGYEPLVLERGGHLGGKVMSSEGYGGMPIEHGVHGWWKGYANFHDVLRELHGPDWQADLFTGPYASRFAAKMSDGRIVSMVRPPPAEGEARVMPVVRATLEMIKQKALSAADAASLGRAVVRMIGFDHARDYDEFKDTTAQAMCDALGVSKRAQELVFANFTLASAFSPLDRISASALMSSSNFYIFDAEGSLAGQWLKTHPAKLVHDPLVKTIEANGGTVCPLGRVLGLDRGEDGRISGVFIDRAASGLVLASDFAHGPRDFLDEALAWSTDPKQLKIARATLAHFDHVWLALDGRGDVRDVRREPIAWTGAKEKPARADDPRWLDVEWADAALTRVRIFEDSWETLGAIDARDVPRESYREILWADRTGTKTFTPPEDLAKLRAALAARSHLFTMHVGQVTTPPHLPLYVGEVGGTKRGIAGICTHFGGRLRWDASLHAFSCQIHGSRFGCDARRSCGPAESDLFSFRLTPSTREGWVDVEVPKPPRIVADHVVLATDVNGLQRIIQASPAFHDVPAVADLMLLRTTSVTVARFVLGRRVDDTLAIFSGFRSLDALFNVTKLQGVQLEQYKDRVHEVIEVQLYRDRTIGEVSRAELVRVLKLDLKEAYGWDEEPEFLDPIHVATHRDVYTSYDPESERVRPVTHSGVPGLVFAGDWVQPDEGAWYMERAVRTGRLAARAVVDGAGGVASRVPLCPPVREPWTLRTLAREGELGMRALTKVIHELLGVHDTPL